MDSPKLDRRIRIATDLLVLWLFVIFCAGLYLRFERPGQSKDDSPIQPVQQLTERLALLANYGDDLPLELRNQFRSTALEMEEDPEIEALISGRLPQHLDPEGLSEGFRLMAEQLEGKSRDEELKALVTESTKRLTASVVLLGCIVFSALLTLFLARVKDREPAVPSDFDAAKILGVFFGWDVLGFWLVGGVLAAILSTLLQGVVLILAVQSVLYGLMLLILRQCRLREDFQPFRSFSWSWVGKGYFSALALVLGINVLLSSLTGDSPQSENPILDLFVGAQASKIALLGLLVVFVGPVFEEIMFRGWLFGGLRKQWGDGWAMIVSSLLFSLIHGDAPSLLPLFCLGMVFATVYRKSGSLWACILVHSMWNATTFSLLLSLLP